MRTVLDRIRGRRYVILCEEIDALNEQIKKRKAELASLEDLLRGAERKTIFLHKHVVHINDDAITIERRL